MFMHNELGHAHGYQVTVEGKNFYGEGSSLKIAKGLAALDALTWIKVCSQLVLYFSYCGFNYSLSLIDYNII